MKVWRAWVLICFFDLGTSLIYNSRAIANSLLKILYVFFTFFLTCRDDVLPARMVSVNLASPTFAGLVIVNRRSFPCIADWYPITTTATVPSSDSSMSTRRVTTTVPGVCSPQPVRSNEWPHVKVPGIVPNKPTVESDFEVRFGYTVEFQDPKAFWRVNGEFRVHLRGRAEWAQLDKKKDGIPGRKQTQSDTELVRKVGKGLKCNSYK